MSSDSSVVTRKAPQHVAFIMDGNGRWAKARGWARLKGHAAGIETIRVLIEHLAESEIPFATFYTFSTENWKRPLDEVSGIFDLMRGYFRKELETLVQKGVRVRFIGNRTDGKLAPDVVDLMHEVEAKTASGARVTAIFAINYSGREEMGRAVNALISAGKPVDEAEISAALDTAGTPDPDLVIRTSGEQRISNFMLWQMAYSELYFTPTAWPDFTPAHLEEALDVFMGRERRFGGVKG